MESKRGLSTVITSLIIILLVLVAIGVIWVVVRNFVETGSESVDIRTKCIATDVRITAMACMANGNCNVTLERKTGDDEIGGVKLVFTSGTTSGNVTDIAGNIATLTTKTQNNFDAQIVGELVPTKATATVYYSVEGEDKLCDITNTFGS